MDEFIVDEIVLIFMATHHTHTACSEYRYEWPTGSSTTNPNNEVH